MSLIECKNLSISYEDTKAIENISFKINEGDYVCIVGENGSGKSSLVKAMVGLLPKNSGEIIFSNNIKASEIGYLPQQTVIQKDFPASVYEVVISGCLNKRGLKPFFSKKEKKIAQANIKELGIENIAKKSYSELSGGQQQRVLLARALCATEKLLLLDEPIAGLDQIVTSELYQLLKKLNQEKGITIVMVSHDVQTAIENSNKILHLDKTLLFYGETIVYKNSPLVKKWTKN